MSRLVGSVSSTLGDTVRWCRGYPVEIGRKIEGCIGVYTIMTAAR